MIIFLVFMAFFFKDFKVLFKKDFYLEVKDALSSQDLLFTYLGTVAIFIYVLTYFKLDPNLQFMVYGFLFLTLLLILLWKHEFNQRFNACFDLAQFMIHLSSYFKEEEKILSALEKAKIYSKGQMVHDLEIVLHSLNSYNDKVISFKSLSNHYLLTSMVSMMAYHESHGDQEIVQGLNNLEDDIMDWSDDLRSFKEKIEAFTFQIVVVCFLSLLVGVMCQNMLMQTIDIQHSLIYQKSVFTFMLAILSILLKSHKILGLDPVFEEEKL